MDLFLVAVLIACAGLIALLTSHVRETRRRVDYWRAAHPNLSAGDTGGEGLGVDGGSAGYSDGGACGMDGGGGHC
ncbi:MAG: hypothetical protein INR62_12795 [Rhodospirillales bacterium]|nr:hypothetical protein [Acetobacter sp.]